MRTLCVFYHRKKAIKHRAQKLIQRLRAAGYRLRINKSAARADLALALGGDGTVLKTIHRTLQHRLPVLPVALGRLSFLAEIKAEKLLVALEKFFRGQHCKETRAMLNVTVIRSQRRRSVFVINEAALTRNGYPRLFDIVVRYGARTAAYRADGLIIATPTGSTAYNLAAGGPALKPLAPQYLLTPVCPFPRPEKSRVISLKQKTIIQAGGKKPNFVVICDGYRMLKFRPQDTLEISRGERTFTLVRFAR
ncbi:MAG: NAD(+)/NADH kinase [Candidatus Margulisbacteria bacterium]|nr:NAD(+)/NADH kinase [Candidatus Margulisiibacteriota bacterium]